MGKTPEQLREEIEQTRAELDRDLDALADKVSPSQVVSRRMNKARSAVRNARHQVTESASDKAHGLTRSMQEAPSKLEERTRRNPLAVGAVAFGVGWAVSSLIPASRAERQATRLLEDKAREPVEGLKQEVRQAAEDVRESMREPVSDATSEVSATAKHAAQQVSEEARDRR